MSYHKLRRSILQNWRGLPYSRRTYHKLRLVTPQTKVVQFHIILLIKVQGTSNKNVSLYRIRLKGGLVSIAVETSTSAVLITKRESSTFSPHLFITLHISVQLPTGPVWLHLILLFPRA